MSGKFNVQVELHKPITNGYRLKVSFPDFGLFTNGWVATKSDRNESGWWIKPPSYKDSSGNWRSPLEFNKREEFWAEIDSACVVVANYEDAASRSMLPSPENRDVVAKEVLSESEFDTLLDDAYKSEDGVSDDKEQ